MARNRKNLKTDKWWRAPDGLKKLNELLMFEADTVTCEDWQAAAKYLLENNPNLDEGDKRLMISMTGNKAKVNTFNERAAV